MVRAASTAERRGNWRAHHGWRAHRGASLATIENNTYRHAYARPAPHHQDEKCTICLSVFEVHSDCRYITKYYCVITRRSRSLLQSTAHCTTKQMLLHLWTLDWFASLTWNTKELYKFLFADGCSACIYSTWSAWTNGWAQTNTAPSAVLISRRISTRMLHSEYHGNLL